MILVLIGCKPGDDFSTGEVAATLDGHDASMCACCGGTFIRIDTVRYRTFALPGRTPDGQPIDYGFVKNVWIQYEPNKDGCLQSKDLVTITSLRQR